jgi:hypothetical protein
MSDKTDKVVPFDANQRQVQEKLAAAVAASKGATAVLVMLWYDGPQDPANSRLAATFSAQGRDLAEAAVRCTMLAATIFAEDDGPDGFDLRPPA